MIIHASRKPDFYIITADRGSPTVYCKDKNKIKDLVSGATESFSIRDGYFEDVTQEILESNYGN